MQLLQKQSSLQHGAVEQRGGAGTLEIQKLLLGLLLRKPPVCWEGVSEGFGRARPSLCPPLHSLPLSTARRGTS